MEDRIKRSPMFYVGDKYKLIKEIKQYFPKKINNFFEPFLGWWTVFLNVSAKRYLLNDIDVSVHNLHDFLNKQVKNKKNFFKKVLIYTKKYNLSRSFIEDVVPDKLKKTHKKTYYAKYNKAWYDKLKKLFNNSKKKDPFILYLLLIYGFNRMLRFNSKNEFNIPVWNVDFNGNTVKALDDYFSFVGSHNIQLFNLDFKDFIKKNKFKKDDFVYLDPPYLISYSEYNKIWNKNKEIELLKLLDELNKKNIKFAISNMASYKGRKNEIFIKWMKKYNVKKIKSNYISYHDNSNKKNEEVLVYNY